MDKNQDIWLFGYGSIVWRVDFPYAESATAYIKDKARRFWQGSTDHRGTPQQPGRVVTLISSPGEVCWGRAFRISSGDRHQALAGLDHREKGGYERLTLDIYLESGQVVKGFTYLATADNPNYLGDAPASLIASQIIASHGPSGSNIEYVAELRRALEHRADDHVIEIAALVAELGG